MAALPLFAAVITVFLRDEYRPSQDDSPSTAPSFGRSPAAVHAGGARRTSSAHSTPPSVADDVSNPVDDPPGLAQRIKQLEESAANCDTDAVRALIEIYSSIANTPSSLKLRARILGALGAVPDKSYAISSIKRCIGFESLRTDGRQALGTAGAVLAHILRADPIDIAAARGDLIRADDARLQLALVIALSEKEGTDIQWDYFSTFFHTEDATVRGSVLLHIGRFKNKDAAVELVHQILPISIEREGDATQVINAARALADLAADDAQHRTEYVNQMIERSLRSDVDQVTFAHFVDEVGRVGRDALTVMRGKYADASRDASRLAVINRALASK